MKAKSCPNTLIRKIARSVHEAARDVARRIAATPEYVRSHHERKKVEMLFAHPIQAFSWLRAKSSDWTINHHYNNDQSRLAPKL